MAELRGSLKVRQGNPRLIFRDAMGDEHSILLAICNAEDPLSSAVGYLGNRNLQDGDVIVVSGESRPFGEVTVFCITAAARALNQ